MKIIFENMKEIVDKLAKLCYILIKQSKKLKIVNILSFVLAKRRRNYERFKKFAIVTLR